MAFELPELPYAYDALAAGGMSQETLEFHHDLHHKAYVDNGNKLIADTQWENSALEEIITGTYQADAVAQNGIFNNASQHWNHIQFWEMMGPSGREMPSELSSAIIEQFGSVDAFKEAFSKAAATRFGSGWAWLCVHKGGKVEVCSTPNQDNPLMPETGCNGFPILGLDVWEHAYYLNYQNRRPDYIAAFFNVVDWNAVGALYNANA